MAIARRKIAVHNPGRNRQQKRRKMSAKQIRIFGTKRQKAALKAARHRKRSKPVKVSRRRNAPVRRRKQKRNIGELVSLTLGAPFTGNPGGKGKTMAAKKRHHRTRTKPTSHRRHTRRNAGARVATRRRRNYGRRRHVVHHNRRRRNPGMGGGFMGEVSSALFIIAGAAGSRLLTQAVLGTSNTGIMGYGANLAAGGVLAFAVKSFLHNAKGAADVFKGAVVGVVLRLIADYTPFGTYLSSSGLGDYQMSNWVTPQIYADPLNSAQIRIPQGWGTGAPVVTATVPATAGLSGLYDGGGLYG
jgi:hypothetical protein